MSTLRRIDIAGEDELRRALERIRREPRARVSSATLLVEIRDAEDPELTDQDLMDGVARAFADLFAPIVRRHELRFEPCAVPGTGGLFVCDVCRRSYCSPPWTLEKVKTEECPGSLRYSVESVVELPES